MELTFLGTGAGMPAKHRNVTSIALKHLYDGSVWLFDCGEATQHQILHTSIKPRKINKIFITHLHGDHIFGLPGLLGSRSFLEGTEPLHVFGPAGIRDFIETSLKVSETHLKYDLEIHEIEEGIIYEDDRLYICAKKLDHVVMSFGYRVVEKDKPGSLLVEKLKRDGIMPGPIYKQLKNGETVQLEDGRKISGRDYLGPNKKGRIVTILGDTRICESSISLAKDADLLIHEATFDKNSAEIANQYYHSTTVQAAEVAKRAGVKKLYITHISSRYEKKDWPELEKEAKEIFPNTEIAHDFKVVRI
ncbi:ribonuclease Z [Fervidibacillus halotolerans]|uniref:Ribonuclease Z n=1 Tax=Fervidibacillus halotolerans TaxID=2980027 RepID=A0A9E8M1P5_9BACI|nr:ribonuclease Z [Fervidibacillus halotolerans]WAA13840.1 ribonuclease Z [Fervidibacillus halotolerans]